MKKANFCGEFTIGELSDDFHTQSFKKAQAMGGDIFCLVNDVNFSRRLCYYYNFPEMSTLVDHYRTRNGNWCGNRDNCTIKKDWVNIIDLEAYDLAIKICKEYGVEPKVSANGKYGEILRSKIIPTLIAKRLSMYNEEITPITETYLRNYTASRIRSRTSAPRNWRPLFEELDIMDRVRIKDSSVIICGGILLGLTHKLKNDGYTSMNQFIPSETEGPIKNLLELQKIILDEKSDPRWSMDIKYTIV